MDTGRDAGRLLVWTWVPEAKPPSLVETATRALWGERPGDALRRRLESGAAGVDALKAEGVLRDAADLLACDPALAMPMLRSSAGESLRCAPAPAAGARVFRVLRQKDACGAQVGRLAGSGRDARGF